MGFRSDISRLMKVATKPDRAEIWLVTKVTAIGMGALGLLGFLIKIAGEVIFSGVKGSTANSSAAASAIMQLVHFILPLILK